ncbi:MAG: hypothetical protein ACI9Y1_000574 [Lentisphaeria bacterium]|jgi:hypothetical protein
METKPVFLNRSKCNLVVAFIMLGDYGLPEKSHGLDHQNAASPLHIARIDSSPKTAHQRIN